MSKEKGEAKGGKTLLIVIIILLVVVVVGMASFATVILLGNKNSSKKTATAAVATNKPAFTYDLGDFVVNLADTDQKKYLKVKIVVGYDSSKMETELKSTDPTLKDSIISVLRSKKSSDLSATGYEDLKKQLMQRMNPFLTTGKISYVYFNDFLIE